MKIKPSSTFFIFFILAAGLLVRLLLFKFGTYQLDLNTFIAWGNIAKEVGLSGYYASTWSDYLPGYLYILRVLAQLKETFPINETLLYKLPSILADLVTGYLIYLIVKREKDIKWALAAVSFYIFNPAILINSTLWGQVDSLTALCSMLAIYLLDKNIYLSSSFLAFGTLIKPQVAFIAPVIFFSMLKNKWQLRKILLYTFLGLIIFILGFVPFKGEANLASFIFERLSISLNQYPFSSVNAFNFWGLWGFWREDSEGILNPKLIGFLLTAFISLGLAFKYYFDKRENELSIYNVASGVFLVSFLFLTRIHERHLLPFFAPFIVSNVTSVPGVALYLGFSAVYVLNLIYAYTYISSDHSVVLTQTSIKSIIIFNLFLFSIFLLRFFKKLSNLEKQISKIFGKSELSLEQAFEGKFDQKKIRWLFLVLIGFVFLTRVYGLANPPKEYFDEVYHAFTAKVLLHGDPKAWEWWNPNPEGFAYEWTHPPLAKLGMFLGMKVFGENSFGYRIPGALLGTGSVILIFFICKEIFKDELLSLIAAAIFALDGLNLVLARTGMNDIYFLFFSLFAFYLFLKNKIFLSALSLGLAFSSKWSAIWLLPVLLVSHFVFKRKIRLSYLWFLIIPPLLYLASYIPMFASHNFEQFVEVQRQMWYYHTHLKATHAYTSEWWSWPINIRPVYFYTSEEVNNGVSRIYAFGNPAVSWFGLTAVLIAIFYTLKLKSKKLGFVIFSYLIFFVPWALSPRIMFYYHFLPATPFLAIATAFILRVNTKLMIPVMTVFLIFFLYFYPHWTAIKVPLWLDHSYYWLTSWR